jgi:hypothetical protein
MSMSRWSTALAAAPLAALLLTGSAFAQEPATPEVEAPAVAPRALLPENCLGEPAAAADVAALLTAETTLEPVQLAVPLGTAADSDTALLVDQTVRTALACLNANDFLRLAPLTGGAAAQQLLGGLVAEAGDQLEARLAEAPTARDPEAYIRLLAITDASVLADGRLAAFVVLAEPANQIGGPETYLFVFTQEGEALRIDRLLGFSAPRAPEGTPEAGA